ncbi:GerMN domain-containing protein [Gracilinema caldarium]|uniref:GerMN domain-containing protein n=1 Tax=Gracilinema caldarium (strain ATCC 51460 / DSM 7334 / H1) TaxID=744872 RepID=F8F0R7_GRAC1|nr:GerMN domain-containing protein [Gracilinema caldarium]AEJ19774.1 hypothetical protein Spica_1631 [Gracilinema caldarium DSM 7334]
MKNDNSAPVLQGITGFFQISINRRLTFLLVLLVIASLDVILTPKKRYIYSFFSQKTKTLHIETRYLVSGKTKEDQLRYFIEEYLLGPSSVDLMPLFPVDAVLTTVMIRNEKAYINLSDSAALPLQNSVSFEQRARLFTQIIRKNFQSIKEITLFIAGNEVYHTNTERKIKKSVDK